MASDQSKYLFVACRLCQRPVYLEDAAALLDDIRNFARLRCTNAACGHVAWYAEAEFDMTSDPGPLLPAESRSESGFPGQINPGDVWVHDFLVERTFKNSD